MNSFAARAADVREDVLGMDVGLHGRPRIAEAVSGPDVASRDDNGDSSARRPSRQGAPRRPTAAAGSQASLAPVVEEAERLLDLLLGDEHALDAVRMQDLERRLARRTARRARRRSSRARPAPTSRLRARSRTAADRSGSTAITRRSGAAAAMPATSPPPPDRDDDRLDLGRVLEDLERRPSPHPRSRPDRRRDARAYARSRPCSTSSRSKASAGSAASRSTSAP